MNLLQFSNFKDFFYGTKPLIKLIQKSFWKNFFGPFFAFVFPLIFIGFLGSILGYEQILGGCFAISPMSITVTSMPQLIFEFKNSSLLKRIGSTPIKPSLFIFVVIVFYFIIIILSIAWCLIFSLMLFGIPYWYEGKPLFGINSIHAPSFLQVLKNVNWIGFLYGQILLIIIGLLLGISIVCFCKTSTAVQSIGIIVLIISEFLAAMVLPLSSVREMEPIWYLGYILTPFKAPTNMILESWNGMINVETINNQVTIIFEKYNIFNVNAPYYFIDINNAFTPKSILITNKNENIVNMILPYFWIILFLFLSIKFFKWSSR